MLCPPNMEGDGYKAIGFPKSQGETRVPTNSSGEIRIETGSPSGWWQLDCEAGSAYPLQKGFSGAALLDDRLKAVVGMVAIAHNHKATDELPASDAGFMIPLKHVVDTWPGLRGRIGWRVHFDDQLDEHWDPRSRGDESDLSESDLFSGRVQVMDELVDWIGSGDSRARVITGWPGSGKSSVLARLVMLADPRQRLKLTRPSTSSSNDSLNGAIDLAIVATGMTLCEVTETIARWLDVVPGTERAVVAELKRRAAAGERLPVIVIDQLDEADQAVLIAGSLLSKLAEGGGAQILVGVRRDDDRALLDAFNHCAEVVDFDDPENLDDDALADYVSLILEDGNAGYANDPVATRRVGLEIAARAGTSFLIARLAALSLCEGDEVHQTARDLSPDSVSDAIEDYIQKIAQHTGGSDNERRSNEQRLRDLLTALAYAEGGGLPVDGPVWAAAASGIGDEEYDEADVRWFCKSSGRLMTQRIDGDTTRRRLFHKELAGSLRDGRDEPSDQRVIAQRLRNACQVDESGAIDRYIAKHLSGHVAKAEPDAWDDLASDSEVLDRLDPISVSADARRSAIHASPIPPQVLGVVSSRHLLATAEPGDKVGLRQLGMARACGFTRFDSFELKPQIAGWALKSAVVRPQPPHLTLELGSCVHCLVSFAGRDGAPWLAVGCDDGSARLLDANTGEPIGEPLETESAIRAIDCFTNGGLWRIIIGDDSGAVTVWDPALNKTNSFRPYDGGRVRAVKAVEIAGELAVATGGDGGDISLWSVEGTALTPPLPGGKPVHSLAATTSADAIRVVAGGRDGVVRAWEIQTKDLALPSNGDAVGRETILSGPGDWVRSVCTYELAGETFALAGGDDKKAWRWNLSRPEPRYLEQVNGTDALYAVSAHVTAEGNAVISSAGRDRTVRVWDVESDSGENQPLTGHTAAVRALATFAVGGSTAVASGGEDCTVRIWNAAGVDHLARPTSVHPHPVLSVAALKTESGWIALTGNDHGFVRPWNPKTGEPLRVEFKVAEGPVYAIAVGSGGTNLDAIAVTGGDGKVRFVDPMTGAAAGVALEGHRGPVRTIALDATFEGEAAIATGGEDGTIRIWSVADHQEYERARIDKSGPVRCIAPQTVATGRHRLAVVGHDRWPSVFDLDDRESTAGRLAGHTNWVMAVCAYLRLGTPGFATIGDDGRVFFWDAVPPHAGKLLGRHDGPARAIAEIKISDDVRRIATGGDDGTVRVWDPDSPQPCRLKIDLDAKVNTMCQIDNDLLIGTDDGHVVVRVDWTR